MSANTTVDTNHNDDARKINDTSGFDDVAKLSGNNITNTYQ
jgi:hypothetical protein